MTGAPARRRQAWLVARREVRVRMRAKAMKIATLLFVVVILAIGLISRATRDQAPSTTDVATVGAVPAAFGSALDQVAEATDRGFELDDALADRDAAEQALRDGDVDVVVDGDRLEVLFRGSVGTTDVAVIGAAWQAAAGAEAATALGLTPEQAQSIVAPPGLTAVVLESDGEDAVGRLVGTLAAILLFLSLNTFGAMLLTGVVEEKTTAVVEVLLAHVRAHVLLAGKVLGIGLVALAQFVVLIAVGILALRISGASVPRDVWVAVPSTIGWFVGGFAFYATLFALAGSFVSRQEDAQSSAAPISLIFTAGYIVVFVVAGSPDSTVATVLSILPPFAPLLMPLRIATGAAAPWEVGLAVALLLAAVYGVIRAAGVIYASTLLHRGSRLTWRQALRLRAPE